MLLDLTSCYELGLLLIVPRERFTLLKSVKYILLFIYLNPRRRWRPALRTSSGSPLRDLAAGLREVLPLAAPVEDLPGDVPQLATPQRARRAVEPDQHGAHHQAARIHVRARFPADEDT